MSGVLIQRDPILGGLFAAALKELSDLYEKGIATNFSETVILIKELEKENNSGDSLGEPFRTMSRRALEKIRYNEIDSFSRSHLLKQANTVTLTRFKKLTEDLCDKADPSTKQYEDLGQFILFLCRLQSTYWGYYAKGSLIR